MFHALFNITSKQQRQRECNRELNPEEVFALKGTISKYNSTRLPQLEKLTGYDRDDEGDIKPSARSVLYDTPGSPITDKTRLFCSPSYLVFKTRNHCIKLRDIPADCKSRVEYLKALD
jgi:hypothetical protein